MFAEGIGTLHSPVYHDQLVAFVMFDKKSLVGAKTLDESLLTSQKIRV